MTFFLFHWSQPICLLLWNCFGTLYQNRSTSCCFCGQLVCYVTCHLGTFVEYLQSYSLSTPLCFTWRLTLQNKKEICRHQLEDLFWKCIVERFQAHWSVLLPWLWLCLAALFWAMLHANQLLFQKFSQWVFQWGCHWLGLLQQLLLFCSQQGCMREWVLGPLGVWTSAATDSLTTVSDPWPSVATCLAYWRKRVDVDYLYHYIQNTMWHTCTLYAKTKCSLYLHSVLDMLEYVTSRQGWCWYQHLCWPCCVDWGRLRLICSNGQEILHHLVFVR